MRLIVESTEFAPLLKALSQQDANESGIEAVYSVYQQGHLLLQGDDESTIYLNSTLLHSQTQIQKFCESQGQGGVIILSAHSFLQEGEIAAQLLQRAVISPKQLIFAGQHRVHKKEFELLKSHNMHFFSLKEMTHEGMFELSEMIMSIAKRFSGVYLLIDSSLLDASVLSTNMPGGMSTRELLFFIQRLRKLVSFHTAELVIDPGHVDLGVKLLLELLA